MPFKGSVRPEELSFRLWVEYYYMIEEYDRRFPHTINERTGDAMIHSYEHRRLSHSYALTLRDAIYAYKHQYNISDFVWNRAKDEVSRYSHSIVTRLYNEYEGYYLGRN